MHYLLTTVRGWPGPEYERWLAAALVDALLGAHHPPRST
jgi:hypothetical protein